MSVPTQSVFRGYGITSRKKGVPHILRKKQQHDRRLPVEPIHRLKREGPPPHSTPRAQTAFTQTSSASKSQPPAFRPPAIHILLHAIHRHERDEASIQTAHPQTSCTHQSSPFKLRLRTYEAQLPATHIGVTASSHLSLVRGRRLSGLLLLFLVRETESRTPPRASRPPERAEEEEDPPPGLLDRFPRDPSLLLLLLPSSSPLSLLLRLLSSSSSEASPRRPPLLPSPRADEDRSLLPSPLPRRSRSSLPLPPPSELPRACSLSPHRLLCRLPSASRSLPPAPEPEPAVTTSATTPPARRRRARSLSSILSLTSRLTPPGWEGVSGPGRERYWRFFVAIFLRRIIGRRGGG